MAIKLVQTSVKFYMLIMVFISVNWYRDGTEAAVNRPMKEETAATPVAKMTGEKTKA